MSDCTCSRWGGGPDIDCPKHGECAFYGHPFDGGSACHCGAEVAATRRCTVHDQTYTAACPGCRAGETAGGESA